MCIFVISSVHVRLYDVTNCIIIIEILMYQVCTIRTQLIWPIKNKCLQSSQSLFMVGYRVIFLPFILLGKIVSNMSVQSSAYSY